MSASSSSSQQSFPCSNSASYSFSSASSNSKSNNPPHNHVVVDLDNQEDPQLRCLKLQTFRNKLSIFFHSRTATTMIISLVALDMLLLTSEIIISQHYCIGVSKDLHAEPHQVHLASHIISTLSFIVLLFMAFELILHAFAQGPRRFFSHIGHIVDFIVVFSSIIVDVISHTAAGGGGDWGDAVIQILVVVRLWRIIRIAHASTEIVERNNSVREQELVSQIKLLEKRLKQQTHHPLF